LLLDRCFPEQQHLTKLVLWRAWSVHNNIRYQSGPTQLVDSVYYLLNIRDSLKQSQEQDVVLTSKGNEHYMGWTKVNVDGSFIYQTGAAGVGVIARNSRGEVLFTAWRVLFRCANAVEAEAQACAKGVRLATQWTQGSVIIEIDCARVVKAMTRKEDVGSQL
ncbi:hypothetical protein BAE44_0000994, partial [Dichanthelium oligosanthes]